MPDRRWPAVRPDLSHLADAADTRPGTARARSVALARFVVGSTTPVPAKAPDSLMPGSAGRSEGRSSHALPVYS
jgi:hypothetical protein